MSDNRMTPEEMMAAAEEGTPLHTVSDSIRSRLAPKYGEGEAREMVRMIFEYLKGWTPVDLAIKANDPVSSYICGKIDDIVKRLLDDEPIQYIMGYADFYGMKINVTPDTLIPRPETAELVDIIVKANQRKDLRVLDAGTGSGCIAIALSRNLPFADVTAIDISEKAIAVAKANASRLHASVDFRRADMLQLPHGLDDEQFDIIVSNPPYIAEKEKGAMDRNVLDFEPASALFVPDDNPLLFYKALIEAVTDGGMLATGGKLYFEINPLYAAELKSLAESKGLKDVELLRDSDAKLRFLSAVKS